MVEPKERCRSQRSSYAGDNRITSSGWRLRPANWRSFSITPITTKRFYCSDAVTRKRERDAPERKELMVLRFSHLVMVRILRPRLGKAKSDRWWERCELKKWK